MGPIFRYIAHFIEQVQLQNWKSVAFQTYVSQQPILLEKTLKKPPTGCAKLENFGFGKQVVDCQPLPPKITKSSCDKQPESASRSEQLGLGQKQVVNNNHMQSALLCTQRIQVTLKDDEQPSTKGNNSWAFMFPSAKPKRLMSVICNHLIESKSK